MTFSVWASLVGPYLLAAGLGLLWALAEVMQTFASDLRRVFHTGWTWLFVAVNVAFALLVYALVRWLNGDADPWLLALGTAAGGQALLRTRVNFLQPLRSDQASAPLLPFSELYARFQEFCRLQIDQALIGERMDLLEEATCLPEEVLLQRMIIRHQATMLHPTEELDKFIARLQKHEDEQRRKLLIASYLLQQAGGYDALREWVKREKAQRERQERAGK